MNEEILKEIIEKYFGETVDEGGGTIGYHIYPIYTVTEIVQELYRANKTLIQSQHDLEFFKGKYEESYATLDEQVRSCMEFPDSLDEDLSIEELLTENQQTLDFYAKKINTLQHDLKVAREKLTRIKIYWDDLSQDKKWAELIDNELQNILSELKKEVE